MRYSAARRHRMTPSHPAMRSAWVGMVVPVLLALGCARGGEERDQPEPARTQTDSAAVAPAARSMSGPPGFEDISIPADNPMSAEKVALGQQLFFDKRLSGDGKLSCYGCHVCEHGLTDGQPLAVGAFGKNLPRSSPTLWNIGYHSQFYWDGRSPALEAQALAAWKGANMGANPDSIAGALNAIPGYRDQFQKVFGTGVSADGIVKAIGAYERTILCANTAFDRWQQGDESAVSPRAKEGWEIFRGKAACGACHAGVLFTDLQYHNVGIGLDRPDPDLGRNKVTHEEKHIGAFKTPTLRDVTRSAPYFHDGSAATIEEATRIMADGGLANPHLDPLLKPATLSAAERAALLEFLTSLECPCDLKAPALP